MQEILKRAKHVLRTPEDGGKIQVLSFDEQNVIVGRFEYDTRLDAIRAIEQFTGRRVQLAPMQTPQAEIVLPELPEAVAIEE